MADGLCWRHGISHWLAMLWDGYAGAYPMESTDTLRDAQNCPRCRGRR